MGEIEGSQYGFNTVLEWKSLTAQVYVDLHNKRIKLLEYNGDIEQLPGQLVLLCEKHNLGKIICTIREENIKNFIDAGYVVEGCINGYFNGVKGYCVSFFTDKKRSVSESIVEEDRIIQKTNDVKNQFIPDRDSFNIRTALERDIDSLSQLFKEVFKTYPTPMDDPSYIKKVMGKQVLFKVAFINGKLVSAASADMNTRMLHAEITDCATLPEYRGKGLLSHLIYHLEEELANNGFITLFSLSRALSNGINIVLSKHGYDYTGRLVNNCNIMGRFEDMNIWVKTGINRGHHV